MSAEAIFTNIYERRGWGNGSGPGSSPEHTVPYVAWLSALVRETPGLRILDVGCGDWQFSRLVDWTGADYVGIDPVRSIIDLNTVNYSRDNIRFLHADVFEIDTNGYDIAILKDVLQHLSFATIATVLEVLAPVETLIITNGVPHDAGQRATPVNKDCRDGEYRPLCMSAPPFKLPGKTVLHFGEKDRSENGKAVFYYRKGVQQ